MLRYIKLDKPIKYKSLNGNKITYNSLLVEYESNGYIKVTLSRNGGCAPCNEIELTCRQITAPEGYVAFRPNLPSSTTVIPALESQGVIIPHPKKTMRQKGIVDYYLYRLNFTSLVPEPTNQREKILIKI